MELGRHGIWSVGLRVADAGAAAEAAAELEELGFGTLWLPGRDDDVFERAEALLAATRRIVVATGIVSIWTIGPAEAAAAQRRLADAFPGRFLLGLGVSHAPQVDREQAGRYRKPLTRMREFLDRLDAHGVPGDERILAALHPKMLELARERSLGSHTYLVPPEHTREARAALGPAAVLAPEQGVVLSTDPERARALARGHVNTPYMGLPNYTSNWLRSGLNEDDLRDGGSDRLIDALVAWGGADRVAERVRAHHDAGADHVCLQVLDDDRSGLPRAAWRELAGALR